MLAKFLPILLALALAACGVFPKKSKSKKSSESPGDHSGQSDGNGPGTETGGGDTSNGSDTANGGETDPGITFKQWTVVLEPRQSLTDTAAIFLLKPSRGTLEVTGVKGPEFLGAAKVGILDDEHMATFFTKTSAPLAVEKKQQLLNDYRGGAFVYFENYQGLLCDGVHYSVEVTSKVEHLTPVSKYDFMGVRDNGDPDCFLGTSSYVTSYTEQK